MDEKIAHELLDELLSCFETLETQSAAILQFLKAKGAGDEDLAPYFERAGEASSVRWRAARVRLNRLVSSAIESAEQSAEKEPTQTVPKSQEPAANTSRETTHTKHTDKKESDGHDTGSREAGRGEAGSQDRTANQSGTKDTGNKELSGDPQVAQKGDGNSKPQAADAMTGDQNKEKEENSKPGSDAGRRAA